MGYNKNLEKKDQNTFNSTLRFLLSGRYDRVLRFLKAGRNRIIEPVLVATIFSGFSFIARGRYTEALATFKLFKRICGRFNTQLNINVSGNLSNHYISPPECKNNNGPCIKIPFLIDLWGHQYDAETWPIEAILNYIYGMKYLNKDIKKAKHHFESANNAYKKLYNCNSDMLGPLLFALLVRDNVDEFHRFNNFKDIRDKALFLLEERFGIKGCDKHSEDFRKKIEKLNDSIEADLITEDCIGDRLGIINVLEWLQLFCLGSIAWPLEWRERWLEEESPAFLAIINLENFNLQTWADYALRIFSFNDSLSGLLSENSNKIEKISPSDQQGIVSLLKPTNHVTKKSLSFRLDELKESVEEFRDLLETRIESDSKKNKAIEDKSNKLKYGEKIDLDGADYLFNLLELELGYENDTPKVVLKLLDNDKKFIRAEDKLEEFAKSERSFAFLLRLAVEMMISKRGTKERKGWLHKYNQLYFKYESDKPRRDTELLEFRNFLGKCEIPFLETIAESKELDKKQLKKSLVRTSMYDPSAAVRLAIPNIKINQQTIEKLKRFKCKIIPAGLMVSLPCPIFTRVKGLKTSTEEVDSNDSKAIPVAEVVEALIRDACHAYDNSHKKELTL